MFGCRQWRKISISFLISAAPSFSEPTNTVLMAMICSVARCFALYTQPYALLCTTQMREGTPRECVCESIDGRENGSSQRHTSRVPYPSPSFLRSLRLSEEASDQFRSASTWSLCMTLSGPVMLSGAGWLARFSFSFSSSFLRRAASSCRMCCRFCGRRTYQDTNEMNHARHRHARERERERERERGLCVKASSGLLASSSIRRGRRVDRYLG